MPTVNKLFCPRGVARQVLLAAAILLAVVGMGCQREEPAAKLDWSTDLPGALAKAKTEHKVVLLDFSGSDWCEPCRQLSRNILETVKFKGYADTNLVLVEVDFPRNKEQPEALKQANADLQTRFQVQGYPTLVLLDADGKVLVNDAGYDSESVEDFIAGLETARRPGLGR